MRQSNTTGQIVRFRSPADEKSEARGERLALWTIGLAAVYFWFQVFLLAAK